MLELADRETAPPIGGADHGRVHELQDRALAEGMRYDLRSAPLFAEQPLQEIRGANHLAVAEGKAQMRGAGREVVQEAAGCRRQVSLVDLDKVVAQDRGERGRGRLVT